MFKKMTPRAWGALALCVLLTALVFATGVLDRQKTWEEMVWSGLTFENGTSRDLAQGGEYGTISSGPGFTLPAGRYRLKWMIEADGDNSIRITSGNGAAILPGEIRTSKDLVTDECFFDIKEAAQNVEIRIDFESGTRIRALDVRLYSPMYRDHAFTFAFLTLACWLLFALHEGGYLDKKRKQKLILLAFSVLIVSAPALKDTINVGHDTTFHMVRLLNLSDGLKAGQFPVRAGGYSYNGYGAVTSVFYPDLFLYLPAMMVNAGASLQYAVNVFFILVNAASAAAMYAAAKRMLGCGETALCASILYTFSIYRISDVYTRCALGEMTAMVFLPLFMLGLWEVVFGNPKHFMTLALSASAIFMSHMLSTLICACAALGVCALFIVKIIKERRLGAIIAAAVTAGLLCAFYLVPFVHYSMQGLGAQSLMKNPALFALSPAQLFLLGEGETLHDPLDPSLATFSLEVGFPLLLGAALTVYLLADKDRRDRTGGICALLLAAGSLFALMSTTLFPWGHVRVITRGLSDYLQFPWRLLMMTAVCFAIAGGWAYMAFAGKEKERVCVLVLALCAMAALPTLSAEAKFNVFIPFGETAGPDLAYVEYTIPGSQTRPTRDRTVLTEGEVSVSDYAKESTTITAHVQAKTDAVLQLPLFGYDGYRVTLDGKETAWRLGSNNRLTIDVPAGTDARLAVRYAGKTAFRIADGVSLAAAIGVWVYALRRKGEKRVNCRK